MAFGNLYFVHCSLLNVDGMFVCALFFPNAIPFANTFFLSFFATIKQSSIVCIDPMLFMQESNNVSDFHVSQQDFQPMFSFDCCCLAFSVFSRFYANKMVKLCHCLNHTMCMESILWTCCSYVDTYNVYQYYAYM